MTQTRLIDMEADPETGFLDSPHFDGFTIEKKKAFVEYLLSGNSPASLYKAVQAFGLSTATFAFHLARDVAFAKRMDEVKRMRARIQVEGRLFEDAENPNKSNTLAQLAVLRAYMPERYARMELMAPGSVTINVDIGELSKEKSRLSSMEAQIVDRVSSENESVEYQQERVPAIVNNSDGNDQHAKEIDNQRESEK